MRLPRIGDWILYRLPTGERDRPAIIVRVHTPEEVNLTTFPDSAGDSLPAIVYLQGIRRDDIGAPNTWRYDVPHSHDHKPSQFGIAGI